MDLICQMRYGLQYHITLDAKSNSADTVKKNPGKNVLSQMIKTVSIRKLNDFNFQWTKLFFQNISSHIAFLFTLFKGYRCTVIRVNPLLSPGGGLIFFKHYFGGLYRGGGGLFNLAKCISGSKVSRRRTCGSRALYCFFEQ